MDTTGAGAWTSANRAIMMYLFGRHRHRRTQLALGLVLGGGPLLFRLTFLPRDSHLPFLTYWPATLAGAVLLDRGFAVATAVVASILDWWVVVKPLLRGESVPVQIAYSGLWAVTTAIIVWIGTLARTTVRLLDAEATRDAAYARDLRDNTNNLLALIRALAGEPQSAAPLPLMDRLEGLARVSGLLGLGAGGTADLGELLGLTLGPLALGTRLRLRGAPAVIPASACVPLILMVHELATNARRHGALSTPGGWVDVSWFVSTGDAASHLYLLWREAAGPRVTPPGHEGAGLRLLRCQPGIHAVDLAFEPAGLWCEIVIADAAAGGPVVTDPLPPLGPQRSVPPARPG